MDTAMRDLDQIREGDPEGGPGRRIAVMGLAALATVALVFAVGVVVGDAAEAGAAPEQDPLATLDAASGLAASEGDGASEETGPEGPAPAKETDVDPASLSFPETLQEPSAGSEGGSQDARPEVAAALAAAEAELRHPDPLPSRESHRATSEVAARSGASVEAPRPAAAPEADGDGSSPALPAAVAAGSEGRTLARTVQHDPLVAESLPKQARAESARPGREGKYTLQVISYRSSEEAETFAEALRSRGHEAFVVSADIPERGMHWRVRIGPFDSKKDVEDYRDRFEEQERMNTYIVKREDEE